jgi:hypothetical protein
MTKTEIKRRYVSAALAVLEEKFNAEIAEGGRTIKFIVEVNGKHEGGCIGRDDLEVMLDNTIRLYREEDFDPEYVKQHKDCVKLEDEINEFLKPLKEAYYQAREY